MSDISPVQNTVQPSDTQVQQTQQAAEDTPAPEEIDITETDTAQNVDTFA